MATINGTSGDDALTGTLGPDVFVGSSGSDIYEGNDPGSNASRNFLSYNFLTGSISVTFQTTTYAVVRKSAGGLDYVSRISDIQGTNGNDYFEGPTDTSGIYTLGNSVLFHGGAGNDTINGYGNNLVRAVYYDSPGAVNIDLSAGVAQDGWGDTDTLDNVTSVALSNFNDTVRGGNGGNAQNEWFFVSDAGSHHINGQALTSSYRYTGNGSVTVDLQLGASVFGGYDGKVVKPGGVIDYLQGINDIRTGAGNDFIYGSQANETFYVGAGSNYVDGRGGINRISYLNSVPQGVIVNLTTGLALNPWGNQDVLINIQSANGTNLADDLTGFAMPGQRTFLIGYAGNDILRSLTVGSLVTADYSNDLSGVSVNLRIGQATDGSGGRDTLIGISSARGSNFNDTIIGNDSGNWLDGGGGDDVLLGGAGADHFTGGTGSNIIDGGGGVDWLDFLNAGRRAALIDLRVTGNPVLTIGAEKDTLRNIEQVRFVDGRLTFDPIDHAAQVTRLYQATLGRAPDQGGLAVWTNALDHDVSLKVLATGFLASAEFALRFPAAAGPDDGAFVEQLYQNVLHRASDPRGKEAWIGALNAHVMDRADVLSAFSESSENQGNTVGLVQGGIWAPSSVAAQVARLYDTVLGRLPDLEGLSNWKTAIEGGQLSVGQTAASFATSSEFQVKYGALDNTGFVTELYRNTLHREPDRSGLAAWTDALAHNVTRADVVLGFSESAEHVALTAPKIMSDDPAHFGILFA